jgi:hypothetical protein
VTACPAAPANGTPGPDSLNPLAGTSGVDGTAKTAVVIGNVVYVGGSFAHVLLPTGAVAGAKLNVAAFCLANGKLLTTFTANTNGVVNALATDGANLFIGGNFTTLNGQASNRLVKVDARTGTRIAAFNPPQIPYFTVLPADTEGIHALAYNGGVIYAGGDFGKIGSSAPAVSVGNAAGFSSTTGGYTGWHASADKKRIDSIAVDNTSVFLGGDFTTVAGNAHDKLAKLVRTTGADSGVNYGTVGARPLSIGVNADESVVVALGGAVPGGSGLGQHISYYDNAGALKWTDPNPKGFVQAVQIVGSRAYTGLLTGYANPATNTALRLLGIDFAKSPGAPGYLAWTPAIVAPATGGVVGLTAGANRLVAVGNFTAVGSTTALHGLAIFN